MTKINLISVYPSFKFSWKGNKHQFVNGVLTVDFEDKDIKEFEKDVLENPAFSAYIRKADESAAKQVAQAMANANNNGGVALGAQTTQGTVPAPVADQTSQAAIFGKAEQPKADENKPATATVAQATAPVKPANAPVNQPPLPKP